MAGGGPPGPTNFIESNALLAMQGGDTATVDRHLSQLTTRELQDLALACDQLAAKARQWIEAGGVTL